MKLLLLGVLAGQVAAPIAPSAPSADIPAKNLSELDRCKPLRIGEASECMRRALGERAAAEINTPAGERYRMAFAQLITQKWKLADPESPVSRDLRGLRVYDPSDAAYVLLADMAARIGRYPLDYDKFARERASRSPQSIVAFPVSKTAELKPGPLPLERCQRPTDSRDVKVLTCTLNADRTISRTMTIGAGAGVPAGATALPLGKCEAMGPVTAGSRLKACFKLSDGRIMRQTARIVDTPDN